MAKRPVFSPDLATYFTSLREAKGWKQAQAADIAERRDIALSYQALRGLEEGKTKNPEPAVLKSIALLYGRPYEEIAGRVIAYRYGLTGRDLLRHSRTGQQTLPPRLEGESDVPAETRIRELQARIEELETYETIVRHIRPLIREVATAVGEEGDQAAQTKTTRRRRH